MSRLFRLATCILSVQRQEPTFSVDEKNDVLPKCLVIIPLHRKHLDYLVRQKARPFVNRVMCRNHELLVQHQLFRQHRPPFFLKPRAPTKTRITG